MSWKILFVCTGNTCRSPMAECMMRALLAEAVQEGRLPSGTLEVGSAGLYAGVGGEISVPAAEILAEEFGLDGTGHRAAQLTPELVRESDLILAMTESHKERILREYPLAKVQTVKEFAYGEDGDIADPFLGSRAEYLRCAQELQETLKAVVRKLEEQLKSE